jgi:hypothetical protein
MYIIGAGGRNMRCYLSDYDWVYGVDDKGKVYLYTNRGWKPTEKQIDPMWGGIAESEISQYAAKIF